MMVPDFGIEFDVVTDEDLDDDPETDSPLQKIFYAKDPRDIIPKRQKARNRGHRKYRRHPAYPATSPRNREFREATRVSGGLGEEGKLHLFCMVLSGQIYMYIFNTI